MAMTMWSGQKCCKCGIDLDGHGFLAKAEWSEEEQKVNYTCYKCREENQQN